MDFETPENQAAADYFRVVLASILEELLDQVPLYLADGTSKTDNVKQSLRNISNLYKKGLSSASSQLRSDWDDPGNRCAYVFLYLMHHSHLVYSSLRNSADVLRSWRHKSDLMVCSIGGGPGSDLVGLTTFLRNNNTFPPSLQCLVLDLFPNWKQTWDTIYNHLPENFDVTYRRCDLVRDTRLESNNLQFIQHADILTLSKSYSAVSAFIRADPSRGKILRAILSEIKIGCFVLYIDNDHDGDTQFKRQFASPAGLDVVFEFRGKPTLPFGQYPHTIRKYCKLLEFSPMRSCDVIIQLFRKSRSVHTHRGISPGNQTSVSQVQIDRPTRRPAPNPPLVDYHYNSPVRTSFGATQTSMSQVPPSIARHDPRTQRSSTYEPREVSRSPPKPIAHRRTEHDNGSSNCCPKCVIL